MMNTLLLRMGAPLQSWGSSSMYDRRETDDMPTKSAVIGMLAAALGRRRDEPTEDLNALSFGVRIDHPGVRLRDYQITQMGAKLNANLSNRVYLSDALFLVGIGSEDMELISMLSQALEHPRYPLFLGRRSCPVTQPFYLGVRWGRTVYEALYWEPWLLPEWRRQEAFRFQTQVRLRIITDAESGALKRDVPVSFSQFDREYRYRYVKEQTAKIICREDVRADMEHDPMKELG